MLERPAHRFNVFIDICAELWPHAFNHSFNRIRPIPIEIAAAVQLVAPDQVAVNALGKADWIGHRNQDDFAENPILCRRFIQKPAKMVRREHAG